MPMTMLEAAEMLASEEARTRRSFNPGPPRSKVISEGWQVFLYDNGSLVIQSADGKRRVQLTDDETDHLKMVLNHDR